MPQIGVPTAQECSLIAEIPLTMQSYWSVLLTETIKSKIHGELLGDNQDISHLKEMEVPVEFANLLLALNDYANLKQHLCSKI